MKTFNFYKRQNIDWNAMVDKEYSCGRGLTDKCILDDILSFEKDFFIDDKVRKIKNGIFHALMRDSVNHLDHGLYIGDMFRFVNIGLDKTRTLVMNRKVQRFDLEYDTVDYREIT